MTQLLSDLRNEAGAIASANEVIAARGGYANLNARLNAMALGDASYAAILALIAEHTALANAHHNQTHALIGSDHTVTGATMDVIGLVDTDTLGKLTPSAAPGSTSKLLKTDEAGALVLDVLTVGALNADTFINNINLALAGTEVITKSLGTLSRDFTVAASGTLYVYDLPGAPDTAVFEANDWVKLRYFSLTTGLVVEDCWGIVTGYTDLDDGEQSWTWTKQSGTDGRVIKTGMVGQDYGQSGDGFIKSTVQDSAGAPYIDIAMWTADPSVSGNIVTGVRVGNLAGVGAAGYGISAGNRAVILDERGMSLVSPTTLVSVYEDEDTKLGSIGMSGDDTLRLMRAAIDSTNLFPNPSFEDADISDWDDMPGGLGGDYARTSDDAYKGTYSLSVMWLSDPLDETPGGAISPYVAISGTGAFVRLAVKSQPAPFEASPNLAQIRFNWYDDSNVYIGYSLFTNGGVSENAQIPANWAEFEGLFAKPAGATKLRVVVGNPVGGPVDSPNGYYAVYLDNIQVYNASSSIYTTLDISSTGVHVNKPLGLEPTSTPTAETGKAFMYTKGGKLIVQYKDGGTTRYKYLDLTGTGVTWVHTTTAP